MQPFDALALVCLAFAYGYGRERGLTWQLAGGFDYQISKWYLNFGYRHLEWDFDDSPTIDDMEFSGPYVGARYQF